MMSGDSLSTGRGEGSKRPAAAGDAAAPLAPPRGASEPSRGRLPQRRHRSPRIAAVINDDAKRRAPLGAATAELLLRRMELARR